MTTNLLWHFPVPVFSKQLENFSGLRQQLLDLIYQNRDASLSQPSGRPHGPIWHSANNMHLWQDPVIPELVKIIGDFAAEGIGASDSSAVNSQIMLNECWATIGGFGAGTSPHNHFPNTWSGQFYVSVEDTIADETDKYGKMEFINPFPLSQTFGQPAGVLYQPKDGLLLLFPSLLQHMVHPNLTQNMRVLVSFNVSTIAPR